MLFLYLVVVNYVHLRFLGLPLDLWGVGGGGWFAKSFLGSMLPQYMALSFKVCLLVSLSKKKLRHF